VAMISSIQFDLSSSDGTCERSHVEYHLLFIERYFGQSNSIYVNILISYKVQFV